VKRGVTLLCVATLCLFMGINTMAQTVTGNLIGAVLDPDGKAVVGATITVTDSDTNQALPSVKSGDGGRFSVNELPPGHYLVTVAMAGFKTAINKDVEIITTRTYELPVKLEIGGTNVEVKIDAGQQVLETQNTSTQGTISGRSITNLPLSSHSALLLAVLDPGAETVGGPRNTAFEGLPKGTINVTFDGINSQDNLLKSNDGFFAINDPRIDDVEEFGITTSGNDPSKTGQGAVQMAYVSKRGGNAFHGGVWEYNRNQDYNSNYYFNNANGLPRQVVQLNDYGYKFGGPIFKDKLFFFTDFDFFVFPQSVTRTRNIYTPLAASGVFTYVSTAGVSATTGPATTCSNSPGGVTTASSVCTTNLYANATDQGFATGTYGQINPTVSKFLTAVENDATAPGVTVGAAAVSPFQEAINFNAKTSSTRKYPDIRLDYNLTKHHTLEFDYHYSHLNASPDVLNGADATFTDAPFNTSAGQQLSNRNLFVIAERWTIGSNKSNELRVGIQSSPVNFGLGINSGLFPNVSTNFNANGLPYTFSPAATAAGTPANSAWFLSLGGSQGRNSALGELHDTFGGTRGSHQFSFGGDATLIDYNDFFQFNASQTLGFSTFDPLATNPTVFSTSGTGLPGGTPANPTATFPGISNTQLANAESLYTTLIGDVAAFNSTVAFNPANRTYQAGIPITDNVGQFEMGLFAGDSWRAKPNLTFNYGLRWEYDGPPWDKNNEYSILQNTNDVFGISGPGNLFHPGSTAGNANTFFVNDAGKSWYNRYLKAFAPSVGLAYQPNWDNRLARHILGAPGKTVLRAGFSIAYSREGLNSYFGITQGNAGFTGAQSSTASTVNSQPNGTFQAGTVFLGQTAPIGTVFQNPATVQNTFAVNPNVGTSVNAFDPNLRPPMVESWNAGIQRELSPNMALEIRYQANHGVGLTDQFNLNEVNVFENGFLNEFNNANSNLTLCNSNAAACVAAQKDVGLLTQGSTATTPLSDFANLFGAASTACAGPTPPASCATSIAALSGQHTLPVLTAAFNNGITPATLAAATVSNSSTAGQLNGFFRNATLLNDLGLGGVGSFATSIGSGSTNFQTFLANMVGAGFPSNFFQVNPQATGGSFITANGAQSTYNALIVDLRHRPSHGLQFDVSYTFSKALTNYQANSSLNFFGFTTLRNPGYDKGLAPFNSAHNVKLQLVYALPFGAGHRMSSNSAFVNRIIGGWEVDSVTRFQTGQPVLITSGVTGGNTFNNNGPGINLVGLTASQIQGMLTTNKTAVPGAVTYVPTSLLTPGNTTANTAIFQPCDVAGSLCSKPFFTGPSFFRADISLVKTTKITERINFEMRMEALNAFNDADFYWAGAVGTSPQSVSTQSTRFGLIGSTNTNGAYSDINTTQDPGGRIVQLVGRINF